MFEDGKMYASDNDPIAALSAVSYCGLRGGGAARGNQQTNVRCFYNLYTTGN